jgi:RNA polymerase sigma-70 factor (ECF subfamily)
MASLSDESLIAGLAAGDAEAATAFVRRFQRRVFGLALAVVHDPGAAEDIAQETFVRAWRNAGAYDARRGSVTTWLLTIARNLAIDTLRMRSSEPLDPALLEAKLELGGGSRPDQDDVAETARVRDALGALPPEQRRALVLAVYFGRTALEISDFDNAPLGTVKTRIRAALTKLRTQLEVHDER